MAITGGTFIGLVAISQVIEYVIHNSKGRAHEEEKLEDIEKSLQQVSNPTDALTHCCDHDHHHHHHEHKAETPDHCCDVGALNGMSEWAALSLFLAMCVHAVLEGMMLGAARTKETLMMSSMAIGLHKVFEAFAVGASLLETKMSRTKLIIYSMLFTLASPLGALIGFFASGVGESKTAAYINAVAAGTFLQVACMEMIPRSFAKNEWRMGKLAALASGYGLICFLAKQYPHTH
jgi:zinc transporter ZupT